MKAKDGRKRSPETQQEIRELIVKLHKQDKTHAEISRTLDVSIRTITNTLVKYRQGGLKSLAAKKQGRPSETKLNKQQQKKAIQWITDKTPEQLKLPYALWTRESVAELILHKFGVKISRWTAGRYLKSWGFTPQKPVYKAYEQKAPEVEQWLKEEYPKIKQQAQQEKAIIYWGDETGLRSDHHAGRSYSPKGKTPIVKATGKRFKANMISAISNRGKLKFMIIKKSFNSEVFIKFMSRLIEKSEQKVYLIVDGHPAHKTKTVKKWLESNSNKISLHYLPAYSPELNPDEYLNQDIKTNIVGKSRPVNQFQLVNNVKSFLKSRQRNPLKVMAYFHVKHVLYAL